MKIAERTNGRLTAVEVATRADEEALAYIKGERKLESLTHRGMERVKEARLGVIRNIWKERHNMPMIREDLLFIVRKYKAEIRTINDYLGL